MVRGRHKRESVENRDQEAEGISSTSRKSESKVQKFERIAERRANSAVRFIRLLGNLADRSNYEYTDAHVQQLFGALEHEVRTVKAKFRMETEARGGKAFRFGTNGR